MPGLGISGAVPPLLRTAALRDSSLGTEITVVIIYLKLWSLDVSVGIVTRLRTGRFGSSSSDKGEFFFSSEHPVRFWSPPVFLFSRYRVAFPGGKAVGTWC